MGGGAYAHAVHPLDESLLGDPYAIAAGRGLRSLAVSRPRVVTKDIAGVRCDPVRC